MKRFGLSIVLVTLGLTVLGALGVAHALTTISFAQFLAVCRRSKVVSMGTSRHRRGLRLCRR